MALASAEFAGYASPAQWAKKHANSKQNFLVDPKENTVAKIVKSRSIILKDFWGFYFIFYEKKQLENANI